MNNDWFECKVRYDKTTETGLQKKVTEPYIVEALSFTEAERRFIEEITPFMTGEFTVTDIKRARLSEIFESNDGTADRWFRARIAYITLDEKTAAEKRTRQSVLIQATDFRAALRDLDEHMKGTLGDWVIENITETPVMDVYRYVQKQESAEA